MKVNKVLKIHKKSSKMVAKAAKQLSTIFYDQETPEGARILSGSISSCLTSIIDISCTHDLKDIVDTANALERIKDSINKRHNIVEPSKTIH
jgi:hypothetical protein